MSFQFHSFNSKVNQWQDENQGEVEGLFSKLKKAIVKVAQWVGLYRQS